jgi:thermitase
MNKIKKTAMLGLPLALGLGAMSAHASTSYKGVELVGQELIVKLKAGQVTSFLAVKSHMGITVKENLNVAFGDFLVVNVPAGKSIESAMNYLKTLPEVAYAEPNYKVSIGTFDEAAAAPRDAEFVKLWGLQNQGKNEPTRSGDLSSTPGKKGADVNALGAWEITKGSKEVTIAVIDTGVDYNHPDLKNQMWINEAEANGTEGVDDDGNGYVDDIHGYDFANNDGDPVDGHSHGTHCAGTIGAEHNNIGVAGVMAKVKIVGVKFLTDSGSGSTSNAIKSIDYATKLNVDLMSNSWGGGGFSEALKESIERAKDAGILFVAAAGNSATDNDSKPHYPSNYNVDNVISVAAHNAQDNLASFSCFGKRTVHVAAPGRNIMSTVKSGGYAVYSGTSMATPHVAGVLGLLLANEGRVDVKEVRDRVMKSSVYIAAYKGKTVSEGRINAYNLLTNTFPARPVKPNPNDWVTRRLRSVIESAHPYQSDANEEFEINVEGAKYMRIVFSKVEFESKYDYILIKDAAGNTVEKISGTKTDYKSDYLTGGYAKLIFKSDRSVNKWGFKASEYQIIAK